MLIFSLDSGTLLLFTLMQMKHSAVRRIKRMIRDRKWTEALHTDRVNSRVILQPHDHSVCAMMVLNFTYIV